MKKYIIRLAMVAASLALMISFAPPASALNLVTNGDFETGDLTGWTVNGPLISVEGANGFNSAYAAKLGTSGGLGTLTQYNIGTAPGIEYVLSYMLINSGGITNRFGTAVNGVPLVSEVNRGSYPYTPVSLNFVADLLPTTIEFFARNDFGAFSLDNVSVTALAPVPEPSTLLLLGVGLLGASFLRKRIRG